MRIIIAAVLLLLAVAAMADGVAYGRLFPVIQETDQTALVHLGKGRVDVDMYIAIDGIPPGETLTYILPFWQKPEQFALEEIDGQQFYEAHTKTYYQQAERERTQAHYSNANGLALMTVLGSFVAGGPIPALGLSTLPFILMPRVMGGSSNKLFSPFSTVTCPAATAKLFKVESKQDLQQLLAQAKLPPEYAKKLARYHTNYYAIMQLHGLAKKDTDAAPRGVHYSFYHAATGSDYTYTYPLGTGGGWAKPILLTEVYLSCDPGNYLSVTAPTYGKETAYFDLAHELGMARGASTEADKDSDFFQAKTTTLLPEPLRQPSIWHRAYFWCNPTDDITVHMRPHSLIYRLLQVMNSSLFLCLLWLALLVFSFRFAIRKVIIPTYEEDNIGDRNAHIRAFVLGSIVANGLAGIVVIAAGVIAIYSMVLLPLLIAAPFLGYWAWHKLINREDDTLHPGTMRRAALYCMWYYLAGSVVLFVFTTAVHAALVG